MSRSINIKTININDLSENCSVWEAAWHLLHNYKNINGEIIFSDSEITDYPIFQFNLAKWLLQVNSCENGIIPNKTDIKIPKATSDLISIIANSKVKTHDFNSSTHFSWIQKVSFQSDEDNLTPPDCSKSENKSSKIIINANFLEKFTGIVTGIVRGGKKGWNIENSILPIPGITPMPGIGVVPGAVLGGFVGAKNGEEIFAMHFGCCQGIIDEADRKVRFGEQLSKSELDTLVFIYKLIPIGGKLYGYKEAADLMSLYLNPKEAEKYNDENHLYRLEPDVYRTSVIVQYAQTELKKIITNDFKNGLLKEGSVYDTKKLKPTVRDSASEGNVQSPDRNLIAEQNNQRLKNTDHRFYLKVKILKIEDGAIKLLWFVNSKWDFESYESGKDYVTELPVDKKKNLILQIPDGLSNYLTKVNKAKEFYYGTDWEETVCIEK